MIDVEDIIEAEIIECARFILSNIKPSEWNEQNRMMTSDVSPIPGMLSYNNSPYTRTLVDFFSPDHPGRILAVMKGAQIGFSTTVIEAAIGWIISQNPGNILYLIGHDELVDESIAKVDRMIDNAGIRHLIKTNTKRVKNMKTGDTNRKKEFPGGNLIGGIANYKTLRNRSCQYGFIDDFEAMKRSTKEAGSITDMIEQRFAAFRQKMKLAYISTPELRATSNIEPVFLLGDQQHFFIPCPECHEFIDIHWSTKSKKNDRHTAGIHWEFEEDGKTLRPGTTGYICQICEQKFDDKNKNLLLRQGIWQPTAKPQREGYVSAHISSLYAPTYMFDWEDYVYKFLEANPVGQPQIQEKHQTFVNLVEGLPYEAPGTSVNETDIIKNQQDYNIGELPEKLSIRQGNGRIVFITCAADLGGFCAGVNKEYDDARLDYEIMAHTESGSRYSISHGSIGTFTPAHMGAKDEGRELWSYDISKSNSVWPELDKILNAKFVTDTGRTMKISLTGIDTGFVEHHVFNYIDRRVGQFNIIGLKGDKEHKYIPLGDNSPTFKIGQTRSNLYVLNVGKIKDRLVNWLSLRYDKNSEEKQPPGYMNFPMASGKKYTVEHFFSHYGSEERKLDKNKSFRWQKKTATSQNHFWDCCVYNISLSDIAMNKLFKSYEIDPKQGTWQDFCDIIINGR